MSAVLQRTVTEAVQPQPRLKFVFFPLSWVLAHVGRTVEIAKSLRAAGHEVVFAGEDPSHPRSKLHLATAAGFRVVHVREPRQHWAWDRFEKYGWAVSVWDSLQAQKWAPLDAILEDTLRVVEEEQPDMIIGDGSIAVSTAAHIAGIPAAGVMNAYNTHFIKPGSFYRYLIKAWDKLILSRIRNRVYRKRNVRQVNAIRLLQSIPLISPDLPEFIESTGGFEKWHSVGPVVFEPPAPLPDWYDVLDDGTINVYITMGSTGLMDQFLRRVYPSLEKTPYRFLVTSGGQVSDETAALAPANFRFTKYAPGSAILKHCQAMIFHGGNTSMYQALAAGVPMIGLPSHLEQEVCFRIALKHGFGKQYAPRKVSGDELVRGLDDLIHDPQYRQAARRYVPLVRNSQGARQAAEILIETALQGEAAGAGM
jgi:UDP:flavonoid glycosyltransferase YjiC (YdhE family)